MTIAKVLVAIVAMFVIVRIGLVFLRAFAQPVPPPPPAGGDASGTVRTGQ